MFIAMFERVDPLPWQKIQVAEGPKRECMYVILKAAIDALKQLDETILENCKQLYADQYDIVQPTFGAVKSLGHSKYATFAKTMGTITNQPGHLVYNIINKVEKVLPMLCQARVGLRLGS